VLADDKKAGAVGEARSGSDVTRGLVVITDLPAFEIQEMAHTIEEVTTCRVHHSGPLKMRRIVLAGEVDVFLDPGNIAVDARVMERRPGH
jgi:hypothetical protein